MREIDRDTLYTVERVPFLAALSRCFEIGIESKAEWLITVDADVLLRAGALQILLSEAKKMPSSYVQIEGMMLDKITQRLRWAGLRCYRIDFLPIALDLLPAAGESLRPESATISRMELLGYGSRRSHRLYGVHDFEQYHRDIYRKAFVHAHKHPSWVAEILPLWRKSVTSDLESRVALQGAIDGLSMEYAAPPDAKHYRCLAETALCDLEIAEKERLEEFDGEAIEKLIRLARSADHFQRFCGPRPYKWNERIRTLFCCYGYVHSIPYVLGSAMRGVGERLIKYSDKGKRWPE